jgi:5-methylcytosine-specific restriction protein A
VPTAPLHPCPRNGCPVLVQRGYCPTHAREKEQQRYNADTRKWYYTKDWKLLRQLTLAKDPVCVQCKVAPSTLVDHVVPHRGDRALFFSLGNLQGLCARCHGQKTASGR